jgi:16S rRNA (guanine527-N7)-methyltransferase
MDERLRLYADLLRRWNAKVNLVGPEALRNLDQHIEEAVYAAGELRPEGEVLDFGSGGGLPAIPMAIVSARARFHLVEADQRKWAFLKQAVRECSLNAVVYGDRLERVLTRLDPSLQFTLVTSRAVGSPERWIPLLEPHLTPDARVALFSGAEQPPAVPGFAAEAGRPLPRGEANYLQVLKRLRRFHVEHG